MELDRRNFLGALAAAPVAAPGIARKLVQNAGDGELLSGLDEPAECTAAYPDEKSVWDVFKKIGMPKWYEDELRKNTKPYSYDPDLEVLVSVSPVARYRMQHRRNFAAAKTDGPIRSELTKTKHEFRDKYKTEWL